MDPARATWTDERLDDLSRSVDRGFERTDTDIRALSERIDRQAADLGARIDRVADELGTRIDALQRVMIQMGSTMTIAILATLLSVILTRA